MVISCTNTNYSTLNIAKSQNKNEDELYKDFVNNRNNTFYQKYKNKSKSSDNNPIVKIDTSLLGNNKDKNIFSIKSESLNKIIFKRDDLGKNNNDSKGGILFDINNPSNFNFEAYNGDVLLDDGKTKISSLKIDNEEKPLKFEPFIFTIKFKNQDGLKTFQNLYNATVLKEALGFYVLKIDPSKAPITKIFDLLNKYNQGLPENINQISFSSLDALQTFTIGIDFLTNNYSLIDSLEFSLIGEDRAIPNSYDGGLYGYFYNNTTNKNRVAQRSIDGWWARESGLNAITNSKIATGKGVIGSVIESYTSFVTNAYEMTDNNGNSRYILNKYNNNKSTDLDEKNMPVLNPRKDPNTVFTEYVLNTDLKYHAYSSVMTGYGKDVYKKIISPSSFDYRTRGVAPEAKVLPFKAWSPIEWGFAILDADRENVGVISISAGIPYPWSQVSKLSLWTAPSIFSAIATFTTPSFLYNTIKYSAEVNIPVVISSGNEAVNNKFDYPSDSPNCIAAGAVSPVKFNSKRESETWPESITFTHIAPCRFDPLKSYQENVNCYSPADLNDLSDTISVNRFLTSDPDGSNHPFFGLSLGEFSNFGDNVVYVPGEFIFLPNPNNDSYHPLVYGGTSAVAPFLAGTIALMKEIYPGIKMQEIRDILRVASTKQLLPSTSSNYWHYPTDKLRMLDSYDAIIATAKKSDAVYFTNPANFYGHTVTIGGKTYTATVDNTIGKDITKIKPTEGDYIFASIIANYGSIGLSIDGNPIEVVSQMNDGLVLKLPSNLSAGVKDVVVTTPTRTYTLPEAIEILKNTSKTRKFPDSVTVNGVTTQLDYGIKLEFNEGSGNTVSDSSGNNNTAQFVSRSPSDALPKWVNDPVYGYGVNFTDSPYGALRVKDDDSYEPGLKKDANGNYQRSGKSTIIVIVKSDGNPPVNNSGGLLYKWSLNPSNNSYAIEQYNNTISYAASNLVYKYFSAGSDNFFSKNEINQIKVITSSLDLDSDIFIMMKNSVVVPFQEYNNGSSKYIQNSPLDLFIGNVVWDNSNWDYPAPYTSYSGTIYGVAIIKQALTKEQIQEVVKSIGYSGA